MSKKSLIIYSVTSWSNPRPTGYPTQLSYITNRKYGDPHIPKWTGRSGYHPIMDGTIIQPEDINIIINYIKPPKLTLDDITDDFGDDNAIYAHMGDNSLLNTYFTNIIVFSKGIMTYYQWATKTEAYQSEGRCDNLLEPHLGKLNVDWTPIFKQLLKEVHTDKVITYSQQ